MMNELNGVIPEWRLGHRLARALEEANMTQQDMADELDVSVRTVGNYIHGRTMPTRLVLDYWARRTGVSLDWLLESQPPRRRVGRRDTGAVTRTVTSRKQRKNRPDNRRRSWSPALSTAIN